MSILHTLHDGSVLRIISAKELIRLPIWQGNRIIDSTHVEKLKSVISDVRTLDHGFSIVKYSENDASGRQVIQSYINDGQHRVQILRDHYTNTLCEPDFPIVVKEKHVTSELEAIAMFNMLNNTNPIHWSDNNLIINKYIAEIEIEFNTKKMQYIRKGHTCRPYLSSDKLREVFIKESRLLRESVSEIKIFIDRVREWNARKVASADMAILSAKKAEGDIIQRAAKTGFMLAIDPKLPWIHELLLRPILI